ncbi:MAG: CPBP family intramembrane metalloprotease [Lachnospiraceae bacterium]|nr:CPBP family intramembrane metalloprotease [Lachnospiraceae bacterium]
MEKTPHIRFFALTNQNVGGTSFKVVAICVIGNTVNVWAEEGVFRGLFFQMAKTSFTEKQSNFIQFLLFGLWHIITVIVWLLEGSINIPAACFMAVRLFCWLECLPTSGDYVLH